MSGDGGKSRSGGCQCGAVRYRCGGELGRPSICHCRMCQKAFGNFFAPLVSVGLDKFEVTRGEIAIFRSSDVVERGFCSNCGTPLTFRVVASDVIDVSIGSLDDPAAVPPIVQFGIEARMPYFDTLSALPGMRTEEDEREDHLALIRSTNHQHPDHDTEQWAAGNGR